jgi:hypothetical protein
MKTRKMWVVVDRLCLYDSPALQHKMTIPSYVVAVVA